jgi:hypothetical protein
MDVIEKNKILGPFIGYTTQHSAKIWIYAEEYKNKKLFIKIYSENNKNNYISTKEFNFSHEIPADCVEFTDLNANTKYYYQIFIENNTQLTIPDLEECDCFFWTMPEEKDNVNDLPYQYNFLVLSCHDPFKNEKNGWHVWETIPKIIEQQKNRPLFAILTGDQTYADEQEKNNLDNKISPEERIKNYINIYKKYWNNKSYRKVLCSLPAYLMWDDHDITDGWGSREDSFEGESREFKESWKNLFTAAKIVFSSMQASRNPEKLSEEGFDTAFTIGKMGFVLADLRSNRNIRKKQIWSKIQFDKIKSWIEIHREKIDVLFFVSPVVFAHGAPNIEKGILSYWQRLHEAIDRVWEIQHKFNKLKKIVNGIISFIILLIFLFASPICSIFGFVLGLVVFYFFQNKIVSKIFAFIIPCFIVDAYYNSVGDLRDDINDSWSAEIHNEETEEILTYLFDLQNDKNKEKQVYVTILTGDIHSAGYSNLYSSKTEHEKCPVIHQIVASPVAYTPFPWLGEAIYRSQTIGAVTIGSSGAYTAQIAHHFTQRNVVISSLRNYGENELKLKVKYYIEGFSEPSTSVFELERNSHLENIKW